MNDKFIKYYLFLILTLILSVPFYVLGVFFPVKGLPFGLPISFLMIFVTFGLALYYAWQENQFVGIKKLFLSIFDAKKAERWSLIFSILCIPAVSSLAFLTQKFFDIGLPQRVMIPFSEIPFMVLLYFLGTIPEEFAWTATLSEPFSNRYGPLAAGIIIGLVWGVLHIVPWSWAHPVWWVWGMFALTVLMRISMVYTYYLGGRSLFTSLIFHMMINVCTGIFPNSGSYFNPWFFCIWMMVFLLIQITHYKRCNCVR